MPSFRCVGPRNSFGSSSLEEWLRHLYAVAGLIRLIAAYAKPKAFRVFCEAIHGNVIPRALTMCRDGNRDMSSIFALT